MSQSREEKTSADFKEAGFEYQYYCFMLDLLKLQPGEEVGYEYKDDIHTITADNITSYIQVKHTIDKTSQGEQTNITAYSEELWKTLSNWSQLIADPCAGRDDSKKQRRFLKSARFIFQANRKFPDTDITDLLVDCKDGNVQGKEIKKRLTSIQSGTKNNKITEYIDHLLEREEDILAEFLSKVELVSTSSDIITQIKNAIGAKMVRDDRIAPIFDSLYSQLKTDYFLKISNRQHQVITYDEWHKKYSSVFEQDRCTPLPRLSNYQPRLPENLRDQNFVGELVEIKAIEDSLDAIADLTREMLDAQANLEYWYKEGYTSKDEIDRFHRDTHSKWKIQHRKAHRKTQENPSLDCKNALHCYDELITIERRLKQEPLGDEFSEGEVIYLANEKEIGWKYQWKEKYYNGPTEYSRK